MFEGSRYTKQDELDDKIYAKAGRRMLDVGSGWGNHWQLEFQKSLDRHSAAMERLAAAIEKSIANQ
jgi:hypothetical protein